MNETSAVAPGGDLLTERSACPSCSDPGSRRLLDLPFSEGPIAAYLRAFYGGRLQPTRLSARRYQVDKCDRCGLLYQRQVPSGEFLAEIYDELAIGDGEAVSATRGLAVRRRYAHDVEQLIKYWDRPPRELRVLDYGAGFGLWLQMAGAFGCHATTAEFSPQKVRLAQERGDDVISVDAIPPDSFHFINAEQVVEHLVQPRAVVDALARALVPGGLLRISVPNGSSVEEHLAHPDWTIPKGRPGSLNPIAPLEHLNCFSHRSLVELGRRAGLEPFDYPLRQFLEMDERLRFIASALIHRVRRPRGTLVYFRRNAGNRPVRSVTTDGTIP